MPRIVKRYEHLEPTLGDASGLTERQCQIAELIAMGMTHPEIADHLGITVDTVFSHVERLKFRFNAHNRIDLLCQMWMHGILQAKQAVRATTLVLALFAAFPMARTVRPSPQQRPVASTMRVGRIEIPGIFGGSA